MTNTATEDLDLSPGFQAVKAAITSRKSTRSFLPTPIDPQLLDEVLLIAGTAPSGSNVQPWNVHVVSNAARDQLSAALLTAHQSGDPRHANTSTTR